MVSEELRLLGTVLKTLEAAEARAAEPTGADDVRLLELREEVAVAKPEDLPSLFEQMHHIGALRAQRGRGQNAGIDRASPYFGHLRLEEGGRRRDVLVGARSYVEPGAGVRIVDWRNAPVSRIFYRYGEGDDYEEQLGGRTVEGVVSARRSVAILKGELLRVASPQGTFTRLADGSWRRMQEQAVKLMTERRYGPKGTAAAGATGGSEGARLGVGADGAPRLDKMLPAIAAMLDPAQFDLIAKPGAGLVAIQGSAGSGKTTVGLHRVAYLAFQDPQRFRADRMLVVVPHDALVHYVGRVLPTLGVEGVPVTTFARWGTKVLTGLFPRLTKTLHEDTPPVVTRAKMHPAMLGGIDRLAARVNAKLDQRVQTAMERWPQGAEVIAAWTQTGKLGGRGVDKTAAMAPDSRVTALSQWLAGKRVLEGSRAAAALPDVTRSALDKLGQELRHESRAVQGLWDELLTDRAGLAETFAGASGLGPGQLDQVYEWTVRQARVRGEGGARRRARDPRYRGRGLAPARLPAAARAAGGRGEQADSIQPSLRRRGSRREPGGAAGAAGPGWRRAVDHARRRPRAAHAGGRERVRLAAAPDRPGRAAHADRAAQGELPLDQGDHHVSRGACSGRSPTTPSPSPRATGRRWSCSPSRRPGRRWRSWPMRSASWRATSRTPTWRCWRGSARRRTFITKVCRAPRSPTCAGFARSTSPGSRAST